MTPHPYSLQPTACSLLRALCVLCGVLSSALPLSATPLYIERMTTVETADTVLEQDELVAVVDSDSTDAHLRYGDGSTAGGLIVASPFAIKSAYYRLLTRSEYAVSLSGAASYTNGVYRLLRDRTSVQANDAANVGTLSIRPRGDLLLWSVTYDTYAFNGHLSSAVSPDFTTGATNVTLSGTEAYLGVYAAPTDVSLQVSNLAVYAWVGNHLIGSTNDCRGNVLLVRAAEQDDEPLSLGEHNRLLAGHRGDDWSRYAATQAVDLAWQHLTLSPYSRITGTTRGADWAVTSPQGAVVTNAISISYMDPACTIVGYSLSASNVTLLVEASITMTNAPAIERTTNALPSASWAAVATSSDWPATTWHTASSGQRFPVWTLTAARAGAPTEFYRVRGYPAASTNSITLGLPLVPAAGIRFGTNTVTSWAELKALLESLP